MKEHFIKCVAPLNNYKFIATFYEGVSKIFDIKPLFDKFAIFNELKKDNLFSKMHVDQFGDAVIWNSKIDLDSETIFEKGELVKTPFDGLISFVDACKMWDLNESTLRKAIQYRKLVEGIDAIKFGKQWVVTISAMIREYGEI